MARFNMVVSHALPEGEALRHVHGEIENLKRQYGDKISNLRDNWNSDTYGFEGMAMGFAVSGTMTVKPSHVEVVGKLPWLAIAFKGRIESTIRERMEALLA
jgi:Putative polyhydroxyalkanoic acid system protein (PHA_gran_rgn)